MQRQQLAKEGEGNRAVFSWRPHRAVHGFCERSGWSLPEGEVPRRWSPKGLLTEPGTVTVLPLLALGVTTESPRVEMTAGQ